MSAPDGPASSHMLQLKAVSADLGGRRVLEGVDLEIVSGVPLAVTGPSGSGKTALCLVVSGALGAAEGSVLLDGRPFAPGGGAPAALVLQTHGLVDGLSAEENVALPLQAQAFPRSEVAGRVQAALRSVGLAEHAERPVEELSGGERQRVGVARALGCDPIVLVADEPTAELDADNRGRVIGLLLAHAARGRVVVIASDDAEVVAACRWVVELYAGRVHAVRPTGAVTTG